MWPKMDGFAARIDDYYKDVRAEYYVTVKDRRIQFDDPNSNDRDWKVKNAVLLLVKGCNVSGVGIEQYWRSGLLESGLEAADFGKYFDVNEFRSLMAALPYMWRSKVHWYKDRRDKPWDVFTPFIDARNEKQQQLFSQYDLALTDESMIVGAQNVKVGWIAQLYL
jgi:hypothetical protein